MDEVLKNKGLEYKGTVQPKPGEMDADGNPLYPYLANKDLIEAVNLTLYLERPLLISGEVGCGKTRLARAVAYELGLPYEAWHIKSTSRVQDGLYSYDTLGRLRDVQLVAANYRRDEAISHIDTHTTYIKYGPLGRAFQNGLRTVVLIDEIDKANIDFPNDLLLELDEQRFYVEELSDPERIRRAKHPPIVFITSNDEKVLSEAFLRRCLFYYVKFPSPDHLREIINAHFPDASQKQDLVDAAVARFLELRTEMQIEKGEIGKKVSTSELIDWFKVLHRYPKDEVLAKLKGELPFASVLLKNWDDHNRYLRQRQDK